MKLELDFPESEVLRIQGSVQAAGLETREELKAALTMAVESAHKVMLAEVPRFNDEIAQNIEVSFGVLEYAPGGAGGGGTYLWEASVSVDEAKVPHVRFVYEGTGIYGPKHQRIEPGSGNLMDFIDDRGRWTVRSTKGQKPQQRWVEDAMREAETIVDSVMRGGITAVPR